jgi:hypothetical protein
MREIFAEQSASFEPETVELLYRAFEDACIIAEADANLSGGRENSEATRQLLARHIIELAKDGERDATRLTCGSVEALAHAVRRPPGCG